MAKTIIFIRGGVFQGAIADEPDNQLMVIDYDDEAETETPSATRLFRDIPVNKKLFHCAMAGDEF